MEALLEVKNLNVGTGASEDDIKILNDINLYVNRNETVAIVGESGCGKSLTALSIMGLLPIPATKLISGEIKYEGKDLTKLSEKELNRIRGKDIAMIFQEPMSSLNPSFTIGNQLAEVFKCHTRFSKSEIKKRSIELLTKVRVSDPEEKLSAYPYQLSGGMRQRVMIAMALACNPKIILADEPTTALDVTIQAQIIDLLKELQQEFGMTILMITHDLGVVAETCDRIIVMYAGEVVEEGRVKEIFHHPRHPYTKGLLDSIPIIGKPLERLNLIKGNVPDLNSMPSGCRFHPRCELATNHCKDSKPGIELTSGGRSVRCWHPH
ncbi:ABC transporter ATP-binding protein [Bacillus dakarensis]|uniref:ABC transporter ATP-binding protein n=1 Tax=Robertmurraya dakarensis TaxID=1926278 RepID=UPI0009810A11|nr:ABC transporter ATP-binding protein [Bacillus dakarensis]